MRISSTCWLIGSTSFSTVMCRRWVPCCYFHLSSLHHQSCPLPDRRLGHAGGVRSRHGDAVIESTQRPPPHHPWLLLFNTERLLILWWDNLRLSQKCQVEISFRKRHRLTGCAVEICFDIFHAAASEISLPSTWAPRSKRAQFLSIHCYAFDGHAVEPSVPSFPPLIHVS